MLKLVTGVPGVGKTLFTLSQVYGSDGGKSLDRPVYIDGIETDLPHESIDGHDWMSAPDGSLIIIDEAQRVFRPRPRGAAVPAHFSELETHRHRGIDIWIVTQDAYLIDAHVRRLVGEYFRLDRPGGMRYIRARRYESVPSYGDRAAPVESIRVRHPKALYDRYKSTTIDTHHAKIPVKLWFYGAFLVASVGGVGWVVYSLFSGFWGDEQADRVASEQSIFSRANEEITGGLARVSGTETSSSAGSSRLRPEDLSWTEALRPEIPFQPWTAPLYREVIFDDPEPPLPAACVEMVRNIWDGRQRRDFVDCRCYTEHAVRVVVELSFCRAMVRGDWHDPSGRTYREMREGDSVFDVDGVSDEVGQTEF